MVPSEEHRLLKETARTFLQDEAPVKALRRLRDERDARGYDLPLWRAMAELGWIGITLPEAFGGQGFDYMALGMIFEEAGRTLSASPLLSTVGLAAPIIELAGTHAQKSELLPAVARGELILALAVDEGPHHDPTAVKLTARPEGATYVLSGKKTFVIEGQIADRIIVVARSSGRCGQREGLSLFLVDGKAPGLVRDRVYLADSRGYAHLQFDDVILASTALIGHLCGAWPVLEQALDRGRILLASEMLGGISELFERTLAYLRTRRQFGVPIGSFQALQHRAAQMHVEIELGRSVVLAALSALDEASVEIPRMASLAKSWMNELYQWVSNEAVQMHGGVGVTDDLEIGLFLKRSRVAVQLLGDSGFHRDRYARLSGF
jgi:alkylation response protein AidB-like acyl-CoA dehydrogenase